MNDSVSSISATKINLHQKSKLLEIDFSDGFSFNFPCHYLRVFVSEDDTQASTATGFFVSDKAGVNIRNIEAEGNEGLRLSFDDGLDNVFFSWHNLYQLAKAYSTNWQDYLNHLDEKGRVNEPHSNDTAAEKSVTLIYFMQLANIAKNTSEHLHLPSEIKTVKELLIFLQSRSDIWKQAFTEQKVQVTVNKQFTESYTPIEDGDEVAFIPRQQK